MRIIHTLLLTPQEECNICGGFSEILVAVEHFVKLPGLAIV